ncbi:MAG: TetR/AcrR family transcriptional regulator C-terminal domain-containing protein [Eubacteriales bacterium]|nr:TetR/AcrR family transcriptional regulator C-terminal domain-containing protein [Eubacteriales bacterium]
MSGFTKEIIIQTFMELLNEKPLAKITVKDIVERCGVNRNTFYYHFRDIPDVVEFAMKRELDKIINSKMEVDSVAECLELVADLVKSNQKAMLHIYRSVQRESFVRYLDKISLYIITEYFDKKVKDLNLSEEDKFLVIKLYKCVFVGALLDWLDNGMEYDLCAYMRRIVELEGSIRKLL